MSQPYGVHFLGVVSLWAIFFVYIATSMNLGSVTYVRISRHTQRCGYWMKLLASFAVVSQVVVLRVIELVYGARVYMRKH